MKKIDHTRGGKTKSKQKKKKKKRVHDSHTCLPIPFPRYWSRMPFAKVQTSSQCITMLTDMDV